MLHPIGDQTPSVYWRRRLFVLFAIALAAVTCVIVLRSSSSASKASGQPANAASTSVLSSSGQPTGDVAPNPAAASVLPIPSGTPVVSTPPAAVSRSAPPLLVSSAPPPSAPVACAAGQLTIHAGADAASYQVGASPKLALVVTNNGPQRCVSDMSDSKIELRVFSGQSRVWSSHDCAIVPGNSPQTLVVAAPVRREIDWSGLTSQPGCTQPRQRLPAGTYSVVAMLAGKAGPSMAITFTP